MLERTDTKPHIPCSVGNVKKNYPFYHLYMKKNYKIYINVIEYLCKLYPISFSSFILHSAGV